MVIKINIMKKLYYSINEIAKLLNEPQYTIRYWEQQFSFLKPKQTKTGVRLYSTEQFDKFQYIHKEIHQNNMSIAGLKKKINNKSDFEDKQIILNKNEYKEMLTLFRLMFELLKQEID